MGTAEFCSTASLLLQPRSLWQSFLGRMLLGRIIRAVIQVIIASTLETLRRDLLTVFCLLPVRSERSRRFVRQLPHRARQSCSYNADRPAPAHGSRIRSYQTCDVSHLQLLRTLCRIHSHKLRIYPYMILSRLSSLAAVSIWLSRDRTRK